MLTKDGRDTPIDKLTPENYIVPQGEERSYHCVIEVKQFDPRTGKRLSHPRVQKFGAKMFNSHVRASLLKEGYDITILHDPTEWLKKYKAALAERRQAKAKMDEEKFNKAVEDKVAEILARMQKAEKKKKTE